MSSAALRAGGILRALTDDHPSRYATAPATGGGKRWHSPYAAALRALQLRMCCARPFCCSPVSSTSPTNSSAVCL